ncbi:MAG: ATP-binding protein [Planctomycetota bacterium]|nr:ATP-binding protein [Planctomycetota bacterium]
MATAIAVIVLHLHLPLYAINAIIALTGFSNIVIQAWTMRRVPPWLVPAVLMLDVFLLTGLLHCSGGAGNPFSALYLVHVAMAVVTLAEAWSWVVVAEATLCYGLLFLWPPLSGPLVLSAVASGAANWVSLVLVSILIAYFIGRMNQSLRGHEKDLAHARESARRNEQLAALTTLAAGAAHELNTPLSTIAVVAKELEVLAQKLQLRDSLADDARLIRQEVDRCQFILGRMRVDVLQGESQPSLMTAEELVASLRNSLRTVTGESLRIECAAQLRRVAVPYRAIEQAVSILVDNAMDASGAGQIVELHIYPREGRLVFEVRDKGAGMAREVARRAGEPFFTTKPPGQGMGLGLFLARLVAEKLGGSLNLKSEPRRGTSAVFEIPLV